MHAYQRYISSQISLFTKSVSIIFSTESLVIFYKNIPLHQVQAHHKDYRLFYKKESEMPLQNYYSRRLLKGSCNNSKESQNLNMF